MHNKGMIDHDDRVGALEPLDECVARPPSIDDPALLRQQRGVLLRELLRWHRHPTWSPLQVIDRVHGQITGTTKFTA